MSLEEKTYQNFFPRLPFVSWSLLQAPMPCVTCCLLNFAMTRHPTTMRIAWQGHRHGHAWQPWCIIMYHPGGKKMWVRWRGIMEIQHFMIEMLDISLIRWLNVLKLDKKNR